jgi:type IV pilus assembly protein PilE
MHQKTHMTSVAGFTLIELLITVAIVAILAAIAYPSYEEQLQKGRRNECKSALLESMQQQERVFTQINTYLAYTKAATGTKIKNFSGDSPTSSACGIAAEACSGSTLTSCVQLTGSLNRDNAIVDLVFDSAGNKRCALKGSTDLVTDKRCW